MKGTFYSADLVEFDSGSFKLLELNTDTAAYSIESFDIQPFETLLSSSNITSLEIIYKSIHNNVVNFISESLHNQQWLTGGITFHKEEPHTIYPTSVTDADDKFILRMAYDENAVFDSTYCKQKLNVHKLGLEYGDTDFTPEVYHSSSDYGLVDTLLSSSNTFFPPDKPHFVQKATLEMTDKIRFFHTSESGVSNYWTKDNVTALEEVGTEDYFLEKYYYRRDIEEANSGSAPTKAETVRSFQILYQSGSELENCYMGEFKVGAYFDYPTVETVEAFLTASATPITTEWPTKHFYEAATNFYKVENYGNKGGGLLEGTSLRKDDSTYEYIENLAVGDQLDSYYISGSTVDGEGNPSWYHSGSTLPSGSYLTSSGIVSLTSNSLDYDSTYELQLGSGDYIYGQNKSLLVYESASDVIKYKVMHSIDPDNDYIPRTDDSLIDIVDLQVAIFDSYPSSSINVWDIDVEDVDTFVISGSIDLNTVPVIIHNNRFFLIPECCFPAGTEIELANGDVKNIEDIVVGDEVNGWKDGENKVGTVTHLKPTVLGDRKLYSLNNMDLLFTKEHPFLTQDGWKALVPDEGTDYGKLELGDKINCCGFWEEIISINEHEGEGPDQPVYNFTVQDTNSYIANGIVVHNK